MSPFVKPPTGKSFRFVRACERARRGEAAWASERHFDFGARGVQGQFQRLRSRGHFHARGLSARFPLKTIGFPPFPRTTIVKPMKK